MRNNRWDNDRWSTWALSAGIGAVSGMRSMYGLALLSRHLARNLARNGRALRKRGLLSSILGSPWISRSLSVAAAAEMAADKTPYIPARTNVAPLLGRASLGALSGAAVAQYRRAPLASGAIIGAASAVASTVLFYNLRKIVTESTNLPDWIAALAEDGVALTAGSRLVDRVTTPA